MGLILASGSASRAAMLSAAGVAFTAVAPMVDEEAVKASFRAAGRSARELADALAEAKALKVSAREPGNLVLGSDSLVLTADGAILDKPGSREEAAEHLARLSGTAHQLISAAVIAEDGRAVWRVVESAAVHVRELSAEFIEAYLDAEWPAIAGCVGCYRLEGPGAQLFNRIEGSHWTVLGMPLLPVLGYLRVRGALER